MPDRLSDRACLVLAGLLVLGAAALRVAFLLAGPLDLAPDEAHYWDWSRHPDWSYYSKGPLVAWIIRASCELLGGLSVALTGDITFAVRAPAVQEALDLFNGKVVDVRETKPAKEGP